jgi:hypothetical protein
MSLEFYAALSYVLIFVMRMAGYNLEGKGNICMHIVTMKYEHE